MTIQEAVKTRFDGPALKPFLVVLARAGHTFVADGLDFVFIAEYALCFLGPLTRMTESSPTYIPVHKIRKCQIQHCTYTGKVTIHTDIRLLNEY